MRRITIGIILLLLSYPVIGQHLKPKNLAGKFSGKIRPFHLGFQISYNNSSFYYDIKPDFSFQDSLLSLNVLPNPGVAFGVSGTLHLDNNWKLKMIFPTISLQERTFEFKYLNADTTIRTELDRIESAVTDFALLLKWRTDRINNWCVYLLGGGQVTLDMSSREDLSNTNANVVRLKRFDQIVSVGGGVDFFLKYFKLGFELKLNTGIPNLFIDADNPFSEAISRVRSKNWMLSVTFEG